MSALSSLLSRVQQVYARIAEVEAVAAKFPGDITILANLSSLKRDAANLERVWEEESLHAQMEVCRYRIVPQLEERYDVRNVGQSLICFQDLFSQIFDAIVNGKKARKRLSEEITAETALNFGFAYPGSLGVAMTVPSDRDFFRSRFDNIVDEILSVMKLASEADVRSTAGEHGVAVVKRLYDWSKVNSASGYGVDISWKREGRTVRAREVGASDFARNVDLISRISDASREKILKRGTLLGIDGTMKSFRFVSDDDKVFSGRLSETFPSASQWAINTKYTAEIEEETVTQYATDETKTSYRLRNLIAQT